MDKKMICGILLTITGLVFSSIFFINALCNPWSYNGTEGVLGSLLGTGTLVPFIVSLVFMIVRLGLCFWRAFGKEK